jgi:REP-associated tyrosine transposase
MSNHYHEASCLLEDSKHFSNWARSAHSSFGQSYNKKFGRRGPVAQDRPKTLVVQDQEGLKKLMFYHDWNPVRAGICQHPEEYEFSTYKYYAHGETNQWTEHITPPDWYIVLSDDPKERQAQYRNLCQEYKDKELIPTQTMTEEGNAFGQEEFTRNQGRRDRYRL